MAVLKLRSTIWQGLCTASAALRHLLGFEQVVIVMIDADNIDPALVPTVLLEAGSMGAISAKRAYRSGESQKWRQVAVEHALDLRVVANAVPRKNSADIALAIEAASVVARRRRGILCVASSDTDFIHLAHHARSMGWTYVGCGAADGNEALQRACTRFIPLESPTRDRGARRRARERRQKAVQARIVRLIRGLADTSGWTSVEKLREHLNTHYEGPNGRPISRTHMRRLLDRIEIVELSGPRGRRARLRA
ncbi:NYN domain-containing protein [Pelagibacterium montanilacus]|uniref:NYN domain-containing protein n=1 Tax=Pelagibacterium montanilacus TaxID=2185280 RepID=UPI000F8C75A9|nr:NYN domain-containing protein [Pelagibacterium montanilacus]